MNSGGYIISDGIRYSTPKYAWKHQDSIIFVQGAPVQNTWYTVLAATEDVRIISICAAVLDANENIELEVTIDGIIYNMNINATFNTSYFVYINQNYNEGNIYLSTTANQLTRSFLLEGQSIGIRIRKTTNTGAGALKVTMLWARLMMT